MDFHGSRNFQRCSLADLAKNFVTRWATVRFQTRDLLHGGNLLVIYMRFEVIYDYNFNKANISYGSKIFRD